ncbi:MAG: HepT-like ribonuclease domain-containing protein [Burkholderiales bacterium]
MRPDERDAAYLWDMLAAARESQAIVGDLSFEAYAHDRVRVRALERTLELIGEAARRVSPALQTAHPEIAWRVLIGQRNLLAHEYGRIDQALLYKAARAGTPTLIGALECILPPG